MAEAWGNSVVGALPSVAGQRVDLISTPEFELPQLLTVSFHRNAGSGDNAEYQAEIVYRCSQLARTVRCDWRGQVTLTAQQLQVSAVSHQPKIGTYAAGSGSQRYNVLVGLGAAAAKPALLSGVWTSSETSISGAYGLSEFSVATSPVGIAKLQVPPLATKLRLRVMKTMDANTTRETCFQELVAGGGGLLELVRIAGQSGTSGLYTFHSEPLSREHVAVDGRGIEIGNADEVWFTPPSAMSPADLIVTPEWELSL